MLAAVREPLVEKGGLFWSGSETKNLASALNTQASVDHASGLAQLLQLRLEFSAAHET